MREFDVMVVIVFPSGVAVRGGVRPSETKSVCRHDFSKEVLPDSGRRGLPRGVDVHARYWNSSHFTLGREYRNPAWREFTLARD
jgi:hypothetical protein